MSPIKIFISGVVILGIFSVIYYIYTSSNKKTNNSQQNINSANNGISVENAIEEIKYSDTLNIKLYNSPHLVVKERTYYFTDCSNSVNAYLQLVFNSLLVNYIKNTDNYLNNILSQISNIKNFIKIKKSEHFDFESNLSSYKILFQNLHHFNTEKMTMKKMEYNACKICFKLKGNIEESNVSSIIEFKTFEEFIRNKYSFSISGVFEHCVNETHLDKVYLTRYIVKDILIIFFNFKITNLLNRHFDDIKKFKMTSHLQKKNNSYKTFILESSVFKEYKGDNYKISINYDVELDSFLGIYVKKAILD